MTRTTKKTLSFLLKAVVLVLAFYFIYRQYIEKGDSLRRFEILISQISRLKVIVTISVVLLLMLVNWLLEAFKWRYITRHLSKMSVIDSVEAVLCGLTWAIFTPNRLGEYAGRVLFLPTASVYMACLPWLWARSGKM